MAQWILATDATSGTVTLDACEAQAVVPLPIGPVTDAERLRLQNALHDASLQSSALQPNVSRAPAVTIIRLFKRLSNATIPESTGEPYVAGMAEEVVSAKAQLATWGAAAPIV